MLHRNTAGSRLRAMLAAGAAILVSHGASAQSSGTIRWDTYGVPHIYGPDVLTVEKGLGYAQMEAHAETILNNVARARGRSAEYFGPGDSNQNIVNDTNVRTYGIPARAAQWIAQGGTEQSTLLTAFCAGANESPRRISRRLIRCCRKSCPSCRRISRPASNTRSGSPSFPTRTTLVARTPTRPGH